MENIAIQVENLTKEFKSGKTRGLLNIIEYCIILLFDILQSHLQVLLLFSQGLKIISQMKRLKGLIK